MLAMLMNLVKCADLGDFNRRKEGSCLLVSYVESNGILLYLVLWVPDPAIRCKCCCLACETSGRPKIVAQHEHPIDAAKIC